MPELGKAMLLTREMIAALSDLRASDVRRGPGNTGISRGTYKALVRRGLVEADGTQAYRLTKVGQELCFAEQ